MSMGTSKKSPVTALVIQCWLMPFGTSHHTIISQVNTEKLKLLLETFYLYIPQPEFKKYHCEILHGHFLPLFSTLLEKYIDCPTLYIFSLSKFAPQFLQNPESLECTWFTLVKIWWGQRWPEDLPGGTTFSNCVRAFPICG